MNSSEWFEYLLILGVCVTMAGFAYYMLKPESRDWDYSNDVHFAQKPLHVYNAAELCRILHHLESQKQPMPTAVGHRSTCWRHDEGNELVHIFMSAAVAAGVHADFTVYCPHNRDETSVLSHIFNKDFIINQSGRAAHQITSTPWQETCSACTMFYEHACASGLERAEQQIIDTVRLAAMRWRTFNNTIQMYDETVLHFRCGDVLFMQYRWYGWVYFREYLKIIPPDTKSIGILTQTFNVSNGRKEDAIAAPICEQIVGALQTYLQSHYPRATVTVHGQDTNMESFARLVFAKHAICTSSTFSFFPTLATFGHAYFVYTELYPFITKLQSPELHVLHIPFLSARDARAKGLLNAVDFITELRYGGLQRDKWPLQLPHYRLL